MPALRNLSSIRVETVKSFGLARYEQPDVDPRLSLPFGIAVDRAWMRDAACGGDPDPDTWYPVPRRRRDSSSAEELAEVVRVATAPARAVCAGCPVREDCLQTALDTGERHGVWGGVDFEFEKEKVRELRNRD